jgi:hypothetical protein
LSSIDFSSTSRKLFKGKSHYIFAHIEVRCMRAFLMVMAPVLILFLPILLIGSYGVEGRILIGKPVVTISIDQDEMGISVVPGEENKGIFTGVVNAEIPMEVRNQYLVVSLSYSAGTETQAWVVVGSSQVIFENGQNTQPFSCNVVAQKDLSPDVRGTLTVSGEWRYSPGTETGEATPDTATILILPFSRPTIDTEMDTLIVDKGKMSEIIFIIRNGGNDDDMISYSVKNGAGVTLESAKSGTIDLKRGDQESIIVRAKTDNPVDSMITVIVSGSHTNLNSTDEKSIVLKVQMTSASEKTKAIIWIGIGALVLLGVVGAIITIWIRRKRLRARSNG